ncbi:uncharacterized protein LOC118262469 [Spodoptera frugiperda]|uniref:SFRICE_020470 n=1 Tax=Spodoptera frugiperda TaxID=7108 RepID=A0A2H1W7U5_SPOFR|nr:uncharacterized protein LOC118262469 [Spodoptera frugiperda]
MGEHMKTNPGEFAEYIQSILKLNALEKMTEDLDRELEDSQKIMMEIKSMYDSVSTVPGNYEQPANNEMRHENISKFLEAGAPKLLMPDMAEDNMDVDIDEAISSLKGYAERLKQSLIALEHQPPRPSGMTDLNLDQYAQSLDQLGKRLANMKLNKNDDVKLKNAELEAKLQQLCGDVNMFTKLVDSKKTLSESNQNWTESRQDGYELQYDNIIKKLISDLNEVLYLLQNKA